MFAVKVTDEQIGYAMEKAKFSVENHPVTDIYKNHVKDSYGLSGAKRSLEYRFRGTLGEVIFADFYNLPRPTKSFGAVDGQDNGCDTIFGGYKVDVKTMLRRTKSYKGNYVFNLTDRQVSKETSETNFYFGISLIENSDGKITEAWLHGYMAPAEVKEKGIFYPAGSVVKNERGGKIHHEEDTYEVMFKDFHSPRNKCSSILYEK